MTISYTEQHRWIWKKRKKKHEARHKRVYIVWFHSNEVQKKIKLTSVIEIRTMVAYGRISRIRSDHRIFCIGGNILHFIWVYLIRIHLRILPYINFYPKIKNTIQCLMLIISLFLISITQPSTPAPLTSCHSSSFVLAILSAGEQFCSQIAAIWF